jgi:hypothetical protein
MSEHPPTSQHNYEKRAEELAFLGPVVVVEVRHDDWCDFINERGFCNCNPDVTPEQVAPW